MTAMNPDHDDKGFILWEKIKEPRDGYYVEYVPPRSDMWLATLNLSFLSKPPIDKIIALLEAEFKCWAEKYPVPLMASAFDDTDSLISLSPNKAFNSICGFYDTATKQLKSSWQLMKDQEFPAELKTKKHLQDVYEGIPARTEKEIKADVAVRVRQIRTAKHVLLFFAFIWLIVIPLVIKYFEDQYVWVATILLFISFIQPTIKWLKLAGYIKPSEREKRDAEKELKMKHYFYHCEKNPDGFMRLKIENFDSETKENNKKQMDDLQKK